MIYHLAFSLTYAGLLILIYSVEFTEYWTYMRFEGEFSGSVVLLAGLGVALLSMLLPRERTTRGFLVTMLHYLFFIPSIVYLAFNTVPKEYVFALALASSGVYIISAIPQRPLSTIALRHSSVVMLCFLGIGSTLAILVAFGALQNFNLDLEAVYQFRETTAESMPTFFGYLYSNVANVLIPAAIVLALRLNSRILVLVAVLSGIALFGMTHHKTVLFTAFFVVITFYLLNRTSRIALIAIFPLAIAIASCLELLFTTQWAEERHVGYVTSYLVRRTLLVPPMLDAAYVELFNEVAWYYWSTSKLGFGLVDNPHDVTAPFLVGSTLFGDPELSANSGIIASGYANAGLIGVAGYSAIFGLTIGYLQALGEKVGHAIVTAISLPIVLLVLTTTDLTTAALSHGLLLLLIVLSLLASSFQGSATDENARSRDSALHDGAPAR